MPEGVFFAGLVTALSLPPCQGAGLWNDGRLRLILLMRDQGPYERLAEGWHPPYEHDETQPKLHLSDGRPLGGAFHLPLCLIWI